MLGVLLPGDRRVEVIELEPPTPGEGEVLLDMRAAGLCGSDLHMHYRRPAAERSGIIFGLRTDPSVVVSHEGAGVVAKVGPGVGHLKVGDRVAFHHMGGCGWCEQCRMDWDINCEQKWGTYGLDRPGAMEDQMVVRARDCVLVPPEVTMAEAAYYSCGAGTGYQALRRGEFRPGDVVVVVGLGPVGIAGAFFAARAGGVVIGVDPVEERRRFALERGAVAAACGPEAAAVEEQLRGRTGRGGADVVVESSGAAAGRNLALDVVGLFGRVVCVGFNHSETTIDVERQIIQKQVDVRGAWMFRRGELQSMLDAVARQRLSIEPLIGSRTDIEHAETAWAEFDRGSLGKSVIEWSR